ncbi:MAG: fatty acid desaturase [Hyphomicrobiales bacterium]
MSYAEPRAARIEWPTIALTALVYAVLAVLVFFHAVLPWWLILLVGPYFAALHVSLQHETLHGHPTRIRWLNELLIFPTPTFWLPYGRYRETHLQHHRDIDLTDPVRDPESYYELPENWAKAGSLKRALFRINHTLGGRMLIGPAVSILRFWPSDLADVVRGDRRKAKAWALFALSCAVTISFVVGVAHMPLWKYYVLIAYPALSLALVRSYCEHQAAAEAEHRTIIVEASPFWSLLFLYNNLHVAHHTKPALAWYHIPAYYRADKNEMITRNNGYTMSGYGEIFRRFFFSAKEPNAYPDMGWLRPPGEA